MKYVGTLLAAVLTLTVVATVAVFSFLPSQPESEAAKAGGAPLVTVSAPVTVEPPHTEAELTQREATYQKQVAQLEQTLQARQAAYQTQMRQVGEQVAATQNQLNQLQTQAEALSRQVAELETLRVDRLAAYQSELANAQELYDGRFAEIQQAIAEVQSRLAEANTNLGR